MKTLLLSSALFCVFLTCSAWSVFDHLELPKHKICVELLGMDMKKVCEVIQYLPIPLAGVAKEICKYVDDIIRKRKDGMKRDEICTWMGF
ncbi:hypothetical protein GCK32_014266 [Trichostrongylus colubriformis]|uniref:Uncharacterized protein n=1 Tax=Trichostrongylus colubriformis TaxID=6319 RepID=A0AAN8FV07_TRICO